MSEWATYETDFRPAFQSFLLYIKRHQTNRNLADEFCKDMGTNPELYPIQWRVKYQEQVYAFKHKSSIPRDRWDLCNFIFNEPHIMKMLLLQPHGIEEINAVDKYWHHSIERSNLLATMSSHSGVEAVSSKRVTL